ncbi:PH domain-containing protein [Massilia phyllosphaerae]|uniref:PH domain-containing protein n=1 Tax=Massilia phyllosphaerae TaxID=3106034 RepID=UPI002B1CE02C|nr:PH domain-containing protein [Massilia sp. SGZ-792]
MSADPITLRARFNPLIKPFLVMQIGVTMIFTVVGIPLAVIWFLGVGRWWAQHYFDRLECQLGERSLRFRKGILVTTEKTIPLENIQDVTFIEGPILKHFNLSTLKFETAGHSVGQASDMRLTGIVDAQAFRSRIIEAREALRHPAPSAHDDPQLAVLRSIESKLDDIAALLRARQ